jgi:hypothetical protein
MSYTFRKAVRANTTVLIALAGPSGGGKTYSALRLARGIVGVHGKLAMIDTEAGRALHYSDQFNFDHLDLKPPFSPENYAKAVTAAEEAGYHAIIIDSMSHEWNGDGGCQDMHDAAHEKLGNTEQTNILAWRDAKLDHKRMMSRFLQTRSHLIFCLRSEEKIKFVKDTQTNKTKIEPAGWMPICEKNFMYEMTVSFMLLDDKPGVGKPIKLQEQHRPFFKPNACIDEFAGEQLAKWAMGGSGASLTTPPLTDSLAETMQDFMTSKEEVASDDPSAPYRAKIKTAHDEKECRVAYDATPETLKQDIHQDYFDKLKELGKRKK